MHSYRTFVDAQRERNPSLSNLCSFLADQSSLPKPCRITSLHFDQAGTIARQDVIGGNLATVNWNSRCLGEILLIEDLSSTIVEQLGQRFRIDPFFFAGHIDTSAVLVGDATPSSSNLPSFEKHRAFINLRYHRIVQLNSSPPGPEDLLRDMNLKRKVRVLSSVQKTRIGIAQHCCSLLKFRDSDSGWICIILVDRPISDTYLRKEGNGGTGTRPCRILSEPFQGGYEDFRGFLSCASRTAHVGRSSAPARHGLFEDLLHYWLQQAESLSPPENPSLLLLAYHPLRVIAAEWIIYIRVMYLSIKHYEYNFKDTPNPPEQLNVLHEDLCGLQIWRRRGIATQEKLCATLRFIENEPVEAVNMQVSNQLRQDFAFLADQAKSYSQHLNNMLPVVTSLISIVDTRRSFAQTANITRLTFLALFFVPLTYISSLFSMNNAVAPGSQAFWVYFAVAIPLTVLVFAVALLPLKFSTLK